MTTKSNLRKKFPVLSMKTFDKNFASNVERMNAKELAEIDEWKTIITNNPMSFNFVPSHLLKKQDFLHESWEILKKSAKSTFKVGEKKAKTLAREIMLSRLEEEIEHEEHGNNLWRSLS